MSPFLRSRRFVFIALSFALLGAALPAAGRAADPTPAAQASAMHEAHQHDAPVATPVAEAAPRQEVEGKDVVYATLGGKEVHGYLARPKAAKGPLPGLIVIQEWWGLNDNVRAATRRLAGEGYAALAVDLYGGQVATDPDGATKLMQATLQNFDAGVENVKAAYAYLDTQEKSPKIGVLGWCFGGGWSLQTALALPDKIDATVMYYGRTVTDPAKLAPLQMPILGLFGAEDQSIPPATVKEFEAALAKAGKKATIKIYPGASHAFANPSGKSYNAAAATDAWKLTTEFLALYLQK